MPVKRTSKKRKITKKKASSSARKPADVINCERADLKKQLRIERNNFKQLYDNLTSGFAYHEIVLNEKGDPVDYIFIKVNKSFESYTGLKAKNIIGKRVTDIIPGIKKAKPDLIKIYGKVALTGRKESIDLYFEPFDKWYNINVYCPEKGYFIAIFDEITDRKKVEEALRWELSLGKAVSRLSEALIDPSTTLKDAASITLSFAKSLTGSNHGFVSSIDPVTGANIGHTLTSMMKGLCSVQGAETIEFPIGDDGKYAGLWGHTLNKRKAFYTNKPSSHKATVGIPEGHVALENFMGVPAFYGDTIVGMIALANASHDYTDKDLRNVERLAELYAVAVARIRAEDSLGLNISKLEAILHSITDAIVFADIERRIILVNPGFVEMFGYGSDEVIGERTNLIYASEDDYLDQGKQRFSRDASVSMPIYEMIYKRKDGEVFPGETLGTKVKDSDGNIIGFLGVIRDITDRKNMEEVIIKMRNLESLGTLAGGIAHDFNNILMAIFGNLQLSRMNISPDSKVYHYLTEAESASMQAKALARQLLTFSRGGEPVTKIAHISSVVEEAVAIRLRTDDVNVELDFPGDLWKVSIDESQMMQVFDNLFKNALDAMPDGGKVRISAKNVIDGSKDNSALSTGRYVKISISDSGFGIPKRNLSKIFDPYFTFKELGTHKGVGLGLSIVHSIVQGHKGVITVDSEVGKGTNFDIYIPASEEINDEADVSDVEVSGEVTMVGKVLLMDDDPSVGEVAVNMMNEIGIDAEYVGSGEEAIARYIASGNRGEPFALVILDLNTSTGLGGVETLKRLKEIDPAVTALISSGYHFDPVMMNYRKYGFAGVITKPYDIKDMTSLMKRVTG
ncbi:MAG: PAS domain S-box protein [Nitrospirota bacterium]|nr:MAG: PAS domain S-box protein [Nitrospirota bacterium]